MNNLQENNMKKEFDEIVKLCEEAIPEYGERASYFMEPATEEEILEWEKVANVSMPESYKSWLRLTKDCQIRQTLAEFYFPNVNQPEYVPEDYVMIGNVIGHGEIVCFSKSNGNFITYFEGKVNKKYEDFQGVLSEIKRLLKGEHGISMEQKLLMLEKLKELRKEKEENIR